MKKSRTIAVIGSVALIAAAFGLGRYAGLPTALRAPAGTEIASATRAALAKPSELDRAADLAPILASLDARDLDAVVGAYEATFTSVGPGAAAMELLAEAWSKLDPAGAIERIRGWRPYRREMALPLLMRSWARRDLPSARAALETIEPAELRDTATTAVILGWDDSGDPAIWDTYVAGLPFGQAAAPGLIRRIGAREGIEALLERVESVPRDAAGGFRQVALRHAVDFAARTDPERAAAFAEAHRESGEGGLEGIVAMRWGESDGPRATEWALSRPSGSVRDRSLRLSFESWLQSDERAALEWAERQPDEVRSSFLAAYATAVGKTHPQRALEISAGIADPTERRGIQARVARGWLAQEPAVAAAWLQQNDLADLVAGNRRTSDRVPAPTPPVAPPGGGDGKAG